MFLNLLSAARRYRNRPSELLHIDDEYIAYCLDEAGMYVLGQLDEGKQPHFPRRSDDTSCDAGTAGNREAIDMMKRFGAVVINHD